MKKYSFILVGTGGFSGGNIVLRKLGKELEKRGYDVSFFSYSQQYMYQKQSLFLLTMIHIKYYLKDVFRQIFTKIKLRKYSFYPLFLKEKIFPFVSRNTIVVYPEIVYGNPLHAKKIVRWFLFHNRYPNDPDAYNKDDLTFAFRKIFNDFNFNPTCRLLKLNYFNSTLYRRTNYGKRNGNCYIIRKGKNRSDLPQYFDGPIIDDLSEEEKVAVFNRCKYCFDYDTQTFYTTIACVCGCIPIVVMEPGKIKSDYVGPGDKDFGKAFGNTPDQIEYALRTRKKRLELLDFNKKNQMNVDYFIQEVQKFWG